MRWSTPPRALPGPPGAVLRPHRVHLHQHHRQGGPEELRVRGPARWHRAWRLRLRKLTRPLPWPMAGATRHRAPPFLPSGPDRARTPAARLACGRLRAPVVPARTPQVIEDEQHERIFDGSTSFGVRCKSLRCCHGRFQLSPDEIRAAAEVDRARARLRDAVVESFLEKIDKEVGARIDTRLASARQAGARVSDPALLDRRRSQLGAMVAGSVFAALASGAAVEWSAHYPGSSPVKALATGGGFAVVYIACAWRLRRR